MEWIPTGQQTGEGGGGPLLKQLEEWMTQYQPVAIFSFGQSRRKTFTLESQAFNERKDKVDNLDDVRRIP